MNCPIPRARCLIPIAGICDPVRCMARQLGLSTSAPDARSNAVRAPRPSFLPYKRLMKHLLALGVSLLVLVPAPLAAQTAGSGRRLTVVCGGADRRGRQSRRGQRDPDRLLGADGDARAHPRVVRAPFVDDHAGRPGHLPLVRDDDSDLHSGRKPPLPFATRYEVTIEQRRRRSAAGRSAQPYTFAFTTPTVKLLRTETYRRGGRADAPIRRLAAVQPAGRSRPTSRAPDRHVRPARLGAGPVAADVSSV